MNLRRAIFFGSSWALCLAITACSSSGSEDGPGERRGANLDPDRLRDAGNDDDDRGTLVGLGGRPSSTPADAGGEDGAAAAPSDDAGSGSSGAGGTGSDASTTPDAAGPACELDALRCTPAGRERCDGGEWVSDPCPRDEPACVSGTCVLRGPSLVRVGGYHVDSTEVTVAHYLEFLEDRSDDTSGQPESCRWNASFYDGAPVNPDMWPITSVDWCDAWAYCNWAGKRLCGAIEGGAVATADALDPAESQWSFACGGANGATHPQNNADCNSSGGNGLATVGDHPDCEGYFPGLFDMEGNAAEWVDSCAADSGASDVCLLLGGSHVDNQSYCTEQFEYSRDTVAEPFGFRCCSG
jgi:hypothetical protein